MKIFGFIILFILIIAIILLSIAYGFYYKVLYVNLHRNFKYYMKNMERKYIEVDVILLNAVYEALEKARENRNGFEIKAYRKLYEELKGKWVLKK